MVDDVYVEYMVEREKSGRQKFGKIALIALGVITVIVAVVAFPFIQAFSFLGAVAILFAIWWFIKSWNVEYEYTFTSGELVIEKVIDKSRRKGIASLDTGCIELVAPEKAYQLDSYRNNPEMKWKDFSSHRPDAEKYAVVYADSAEKAVYLIEVSEKMLNAMRQVSPRKVVMK